MAYVPISKSLIEEVTGRINNMCAAELGTLTDPSSRVGDLANDPIVQECVATQLWGEYLDLRPRLQHMNYEGRVVLTIKLPDEDGQRVHSLRLQVTASVPKIVDSTYYHAKVVGVNYTDAPILAEVAEQHRLYEEAKTRWTRVKSQVIGFLDKCKSVNEAVKLWPDIVQYLPKQARERLEEKVEKTTKPSGAADALAALDVDLLNASVVLARMAQSQSKE